MVLRNETASFSFPAFVINLGPIPSALIYACSPTGLIGVRLPIGTKARRNGAYLHHPLTGLSATGREWGGSVSTLFLGSGKSLDSNSRSN